MKRLEHLRPAGQKLYRSIQRRQQQPDLTPRQRKMLADHARSLEAMDAAASQRQQATSSSSTE